MATETRRLTVELDVNPTINAHTDTESSESRPESLIVELECNITQIEDNHRNHTESKPLTKAKENMVLQPGDEPMTREEIPSQHCCFYFICYVGIIILGITAVVYVYWVYQNQSKSLDWLYQQYYVAVGNLLFLILFNWFNGAIFRDYFGIKGNYTRKITHITIYTLPFIIGATIGTLDPIIAILWGSFQSFLWLIVCTIPIRKCWNNYCCHYQKSRCKYLNLPEYVLHAMERSEDRPNTLYWLFIQIILLYVLLLPMGIWWESLDVPLLVLVPQIVIGFGDGLAEPVGVRFGKNCQYKAKGCCTKHDYVRSVPGSAMVLLSGYVGVGVAFNEYTLGQFIIAMIVVPIVGMIVEAKAPHTLDNPFIGLFVGIAATFPLYIDI